MITSCYRDRNKPTFEKDYEVKACHELDEHDGEDDDESDDESDEEDESCTKNFAVIVGSKTSPAKAIAKIVL